MPKIRTLSSAIKELKEIDPNCSLTLTALRRKIRNNELPYAKVGNKYLVDLDVIVKILFVDNKELVLENEIN